jgi:RNA polymerase sigma factor (sigma-70 family)
MTSQAPRSTIEAIWRLESGRIIASLARLVRDVGLAEELAQDAFVDAIEQWPASGVPANPRAWLMLTAKHRAIDRLRRNDRLDDRIAELGHSVRSRQLTAAFDEPPDLAAVSTNEGLDDDLLRLVFVACHPALSQEARTALTLRVVVGLSTGQIARAFLVSEATVAQRIVRAKRVLRDQRVPFKVPPAPERDARLASVLEVVYLIFNEGYTATDGDEWMRPELCHEALRLGRILAELMPAEPEVHGLVALMEIQSSRASARVSPSGEPIPLLEQNRGRWDRLLIRRGYRALLRAEQTGRPIGPYVLQAAIAACHTMARSPADTDWVRIEALYDNLSQISPTPVVALNRAVAVAMSSGPHDGLELVDALAGDPTLRTYHLLPSVRADLLVRLGRAAEARAEFERAASLARNARERAALLARADACTHP